MKTRFGLYTILLALLALSFTGVTAQETVETVCLITDIGRINDATFNQSAYEGMIRAADDFDLESSFIETQTEVDYAANIATCLRDGFDIIITVGFSLADATYEAALDNPDVYFIGVDQFVEAPLPNVVGLQFREDQAGFLVGVLAASVTESGIIAGVYGIDIPPVVRFRNGYEQGARYVNPDITVLGVYIDDFQAPDRGASAAAQFIGEGADVIFGAGGPTGSGGITLGAQQEVWVIGVDQDEYFTTFGGGESPGAEFLISSSIKRVDNGVYDLIERVVTGEGFPEDSLYVLTVENEGISFACRHDAEIGVPCDEDGLPDLTGDDELTVVMREVMDGLRDGTLETGVDFQTGELIEEATAAAPSAP